jgi:CheY-like chemotaxis protein
VRSTDAAVVEPIEVLSVGSLKGLRVAVIEDDPEVWDGMREMLGAWGCIVIDGTDAASVIASAGPPTLAHAWLDAAIADFRLRHGRNGVQETELLRAASGHSIPALLISGDWAPERLAEMRASGLELLSKPVAAARVRSWLLSLRPRAAVEPAEKATP